jgi:large subunit ribosomal protein L32e
MPETKTKKAVKPKKKAVAKPTVTKVTKAKPVAKKAEAKPVKKVVVAKKAEAKKPEAKIKAKEKAVTKKPKKPAAKAKGKKSKEVKALAKKIKGKKKRMFRGRFGNRSVKRIANKKWQRWRKPRGIDIYFKEEDGLYPKTGYRTPLEIRGRHPSGFNEVLVRNLAEVEVLAGQKDTAIKLSATLGKRKKKILVDKAKEIGLVVLNG